MKKRVLIALVVVLALAATASLVWANMGGLVSYWPFDEGSGTTAYDAVNDNNGSISGAVWVPGKFGQALDFDGIFTGDQAGGDYVFVPGPSSLHITDKLTVEAWIEPTGVPGRGYGDIVRLGTGYELCLRPDGRLEIAIYRSGGWSWWDSIGTIPIPASQFYHVAFTYDKDGGTNNLKIYINGALDVQYTVGSWALQPSGDLWISPWFWPFKGIIDEVGIWNRALSADEIALLSSGVEIDIKPGSDPNCFNSDGHGVIPVAILSTTNFDATTVDPATVTLAGMGIRMAGKSGKYLAHTENVNGDALADLVLQIEDSDGSLAPGATTATLRGFTYDGLPIVGTDSICIRPPE